MRDPWCRTVGRGVLSLFFALALSVFSVGQSMAEEDMPSPKVSVLQVRAQQLPVMNELPGRIAATRVAEVRPRVSGIIVERVFTQGSFVKENDVLFRIDPALFRVKVASAEASLQRAKATRLQAKQHFDRQKALRERQVTSGAELDNASATLAQAEADVALQEATLEEAKILLGYTEVRAPISGVIGSALVTEGALVSSEGTQVLALIQQLDPVYTDFTQSSSELLALRRAFQAGHFQSIAPGEARLHLILEDGTLYPEPGRLLFSEASVDPMTGQVTLRGEFPNPQGELLPGLYVRIRIEQARREAAIAIPQRAIMRDAQGAPYLFTLTDDDRIETRPVVLGQSLGSWWIVEKGLAEGERVVVEGLQKIQPGASVITEAWKESAYAPDMWDDPGRSPVKIGLSDTTSETIRRN